MTFKSFISSKAFIITGSSILGTAAVGGTIGGIIVATQKTETLGGQNPKINNGGQTPGSQNPQINDGGQTQTGRESQTSCVSSLATEPTMNKIAFSAFVTQLGPKDQLTIEKLVEVLKTNQIPVATPIACSGSSTQLHMLGDKYHDLANLVTSLKATSDLSTLTYQQFIEMFNENFGVRALAKTLFDKVIILEGTTNQPIPTSGGSQTSTPTTKSAAFIEMINQVKSMNITSADIKSLTKNEHINEHIIAFSQWLLSKNWPAGSGTSGIGDLSSSAIQKLLQAFVSHPDIQSATFKEFITTESGNLGYSTNQIPNKIAALADSIHFN